MTFYNSFEEFEKAAEALYLQSPDKVRYSVKYTHSKNLVIMKITDNAICCQFKTEIAQDVKKMDKFINNLMRHMVSKEH
ncbi:hypothetical protein ILUMI_24890 [Ignelater luminosus]|uniref:Signal recognition particle 9 kDa protein n=1 Tax=Ignelater luminosus TaxID=2038154 RepID=A0A8K0CCP2_IGNLU|nr:hypothetical protein ILUMI_24890 [Ignelater luminosus]